MNLSRRSLLTGLLSSAAVIAAGPVAKIAVVDDGFGVGPAMQALPARPTLEDYARRVLGNSDWRRVARIADVGFNVLDGGASPPYAGDFDKYVAVGTFPRNSRAGMTFRLLA